MLAPALTYSTVVSTLFVGMVNVNSVFERAVRVTEYVTGSCAHTVCVPRRMQTAASSVTNQCRFIVTILFIILLLYMFILFILLFRLEGRFSKRTSQRGRPRGCPTLLGQGTLGARHFPCFGQRKHSYLYHLYLHQISLDRLC